MLSRPKIFPFPPESLCISVPTRNLASIMLCLHVPHHRAWYPRRQCSSWPNVFHYLLKFTVCRNFRQHKTGTRLHAWNFLPYCTCNARRLAIFRTQRVCCAALHGSDTEKARHIFSSLRHAPPPLAQSNNTVLPPVATHNCPVLHIFQSLFG